jgi:hypothetical protein
MLRAVVAPATWAASEEPESVRGTIALDADKGTLAIRQRMAVHMQLLVACEKLRLARGGAPVSRYDRELFRLDSRSARARSRLAKPVSLNFQQPTRLVTVLEQLGQAAGLRILVDWRDAATAGWNPDGEATLLADKQPLAESLDALLDPLDLAWRVVDERTIQVVTPERLNDHLELEVYKVDSLLGDDPEGESLVARVRAALGEGLFQSAGGTSAVRFDVEGRCLLVSLSQPKHRELERLLEEWQGEIADPTDASPAAPSTRVVRP